MRHLLRISIIAALIAATTVIAPTSAQAASPVTINKIGTKTVAAGKKAVIKASVTRDYEGKVISKRITVKKAGKTIAKNRISVRLGVGTYKVTTVVKYKTYSWNTYKWSKTKKKSRTQTLVIKQKVAVKKKPVKSAYYKNCTEARNAGAAPVYRGDPGYGRHLDRDGDGVGCE